MTLDPIPHLMFQVQDARTTCSYPPIASLIAIPHCTVVVVATTKWKLAEEDRPRLAHFVEL
jgi:hypothetical protein